MLVDFRAGMATYKIAPTAPPSPGKVEELRKALADCAECLKRLPDVDGAYRVTCLDQAQRALKPEPVPPEPPTRLEADMGRAFDLINKAFTSHDKAFGS